MAVNLAKKLKTNTEVMEATFQKNNLQLLHYTFRSYMDEDDADCELIIEVASIEGNDIPDDIEIKVNLYDVDGEIILSEDCYIDSDEFDGYDTFKMDLCDDGKTLKEAKSARIFVGH